MTIIFRTVLRQEAQAAYEWHRARTQDAAHVLPRQLHEIQGFAREGLLWCAFDAERNTYAGMAYAHEDPNDGQPYFELGGLVTDPRYRQSGIGTVVMLATLGSLLFETNPIELGMDVLCHVHVDNPYPRRVIEDQLKFRYRQSVSIPPEAVPGLPVGSDGMVHGHQFELGRPDTLHALVECHSAWPKTLRNGMTAQIELREYVTPTDWVQAFTEMVAY